MALCPGPLFHRVPWWCGACREGSWARSEGRADRERLRRSPDDAV